ncbi:MAG: flap endonuclease-1 [archaeon]
MGLNIAEIVPRKAIQLSDLKGKLIAVDASNIIYQFLSTIRQPDGTPLQDSKGNITSHLSGLFYRNVSLLLEGMRLVYVFDGKMPDLKYGTNKKRQDIKDKAEVKYREAREKGEFETAWKYARQTVRLTSEIAEESKQLLKAMGIAVIQAPSEAEAQAAEVSRNSAYAVGSQDYDSLLFGAPRLLQNLTLAKKRKTASGFVYISPEIIELEKVLNSLEINLDQLICLGILVGTDYNPSGVKGIGPKKALALVRSKKQPVLIFDEVAEQIRAQDEEGYGFDWQEIFGMFHQPEVVKNPEVDFPKINKDKIKKILMDRDFSEERINNQLLKLDEAKERAKQRTLF